MIEYRAAALLFDMDGTVVDSTAVVRRTWTAFARRHGLDADSVLAFAHGRPTRATVARFLPDDDLVTRETLRLATEEETTLDGIVEIPGAAALLRALPTGAWAVVTSAGRTLAGNRMAAAGIPIPEVLVTADDITRGKPDPQGYLIAANTLGAALADCLVFEDSDAGIRAGLACGSSTIAVGNFSAFDHAVTRIPDFSTADVTPDRTGGLIFTARTYCAGRYQSDRK